MLEIKDTYTDSKQSLLIIEGGNRIEGEIKVQGAKNSSLPVLAAAFCAELRVLYITVRRFPIHTLPAGYFHPLAVNAQGREEVSPSIPHQLRGIP